MSERKNIATNRRASFDYKIIQKYEAGIILTGSEVKSLRKAHTTIAEGYVTYEEGSLIITNITIEEYKNAAVFGHEPKRNRQLLMHRKEIEKLRQAIKRKGYTIVPLNMYFNNKGCVKLEIGLAEGKNNIDKRHTIKEREWNIDKKRLLKMKQR